MKATVTVSIPASRKPRNRLVAAARFRQAGRHASLRHPSRQQAATTLRREAAEAARPRYSP